MPTTATVPRTRPRGEIRRSQILDAAVEVFLENGYGGATIDLVVERTGASKATVYSFFGGKDGLFAAIVGDVEWSRSNSLSELSAVGANAAT
jgi:AcrR family transcriptional regulator